MKTTPNGIRLENPVARLAQPKTCSMMKDGTPDVVKKRNMPDSKAEAMCFQLHDTMEMLLRLVRVRHFTKTDESLDRANQDVGKHIHMLRQQLSNLEDDIFGNKV